MSSGNFAQLWGYANGAAMLDLDKLSENELHTLTLTNTEKNRKRSLVRRSLGRLRDLTNYLSLGSVGSIDDACQDDDLTDNSKSENQASAGDKRNANDDDSASESSGHLSDQSFFSISEASFQSMTHLSTIKASPQNPQKSTITTPTKMPAEKPVHASRITISPIVTILSLDKKTKKLTVIEITRRNHPERIGPCYTSRQIELAVAQTSSSPTAKSIFRADDIPESLYSPTTPTSTFSFSSSTSNASPSAAIARIIPRPFSRFPSIFSRRPNDNQTPCAKTLNPFQDPSSVEQSVDDIELTRRKFDEDLVRDAPIRHRKYNSANGRMTSIEKTSEGSGRYDGITADRTPRRIFCKADIEKLGGNVRKSSEYGKVNNNVLKNASPRRSGGTTRAFHDAGSVGLK